MDKAVIENVVIELQSQFDIDDIVLARTIHIIETKIAKILNQNGGYVNQAFCLGNTTVHLIARTGSHEYNHGKVFVGESRKPFDQLNVEQISMLYNIIIAKTWQSLTLK